MPPCLLAELHLNSLDWNSIDLGVENTESFGLGDGGGIGLGLGVGVGFPGQLAAQLATHF